MILCKNCGNEFSGKYCNACGQPGDTSRIGRLFVARELRKSFIHFWDDGLFYTTRWLFTNPGKTIKAYLEGKRVQHMKPFAYLLLMGGLYVLLSRYFHLNMVTADIEGHKAEELNGWLYRYYTEVQLLLLFVYSSFSVLFFSQKTYNFYEFLVIHTFLAGQRLMIAVTITIPILALLNDAAYIKPIVYIMSLPGHLLMIWTYSYLFNGMRIKVIAKTILILLLSLVGAALIVALLILLI